MFVDMNEVIGKFHRNENGYFTVDLDDLAHISTYNPISHGYWETDRLDEVFNMQGHCSLCHFSVPDIRYNFCPRCGARMDGRNPNEND